MDKCAFKDTPTHFRLQIGIAMTREMNSSHHEASQRVLTAPAAADDRGRSLAT